MLIDFPKSQKNLFYHTGWTIKYFSAQWKFIIMYSYTAVNAELSKELQCLIWINKINPSDEKIKAKYLFICVIQS